MRHLRLVVPVLPNPNHLRRWIRENGGFGGEDGFQAASVSHEDEMAAKGWVNETTAGRRPRQLTRSEQRALVRIFPGLSTDTRRLVAGELGSAVAKLSHLWTLWREESAPEVRRELESVLGPRLAQARERNPQALQWLPMWLTESRGTFEIALAECESIVAERYPLAPFTLWDFQQSVKLSASSTIGQEIIRRVLVQHRKQIRSVMQRGELLDWAEKNSRAQDLVIDLCLSEFEGQAFTLRQREADGIELVAARAMAWLEDPDRMPATRWSRVSGTAIGVMRRYLVQQEFAKIIEQFRRDSLDQERARFWSSYSKEIVDARLVPANDVKGVAVCMMVIGDAAFVEFGATGNACYVYKKPATVLRIASLPTRLDVSHFKYGLPIRGSAEFVEKWSHTYYWEERFSEGVSRLKGGV